jgi:hypothetical protein
MKTVADQFVDTLAARGIQEFLVVVPKGSVPINGRKTLPSVFAGPCLFQKLP